MKTKDLIVKVQVFDDPDYCEITTMHDRQCYFLKESEDDTLPKYCTLFPAKNGVDLDLEFETMRYEKCLECKKLFSEQHGQIDVDFDDSEARPG